MMYLVVHKWKIMKKNSIRQCKHKVQSVLEYLINIKSSATVTLMNQLRYRHAITGVSYLMVENITEVKTSMVQTHLMHD